MKRYSLLFKPAFFFFLLLFIQGCSEQVQKKMRVNSEFASYIGAYTSGMISKESTIQIQLTEDYDGEINYDAPIEADLFDFSPSIPGEAWWVNSNTIEFRPDELLASGQQYQVNFRLSALMDISDDLEVFAFNFSTVNQNFIVYSDGLSTTDFSDFKKQKLEGRLVTADLADSLNVEKTLKAYQNGKELTVSWFHIDGLVHRFVVNGIVRQKKQSSVKLVYNGAALNVDESFEEVFEIPALGDFKVTKMDVIHEPEQYVRIHFSDPLKTDQALKGIITIEDISNLRFSVEGHNVNVYLPNRVAGNKTVTVDPGVKNSNGYKMINGDAIELVFEGIKPDVRLVGDGVIIPNTSEGLLFPFEAVNLRAVDVYITKIYQKNVLQFLQVNNLDGSYQLKRVSNEVMRKRVDLNQMSKVNLHEWNRFQLDLSEMCSVDPGAIYQIELRFKQAYSVYGCDGQKMDANLEELEVVQQKDWNENGWDSYDYWYDYDYWDYEDDYDYKERKNPCSPSYYRNKSIKANVLASDIGIVAKAGGDKTMHIFLNNILSTDPISGSTIEFYDYQQQLLGSAVSDENGMASIKLNKKPFVVVAKSGNQRGYLKLRDGEALSMSKFDVAGATVQKGIKGFIYAERGVWRPGDSIYVSFMLEDKNKILPVKHPVTFDLYNPQGQVVEKKVTSKNVNGLFDFRTSTAMEDVTGNYMARVKVGNRVFTKNLKVETVKPNRLKIYLDFGKDKLSQLDESNQGTISVKWLHGAIARNLKAKIDLTVNSKRTTFKKFERFVFDDPLKSYDTEEQTVFEAYVDENGEASVDPDIYIGNSAPGMLTANFVTKVFEEGGGFSIDRYSIPYSPYKSYVGVDVPEGNLYRGTLVTDEDHTIDIATVDANGKPISRSNLDVKVYKIQWRWWWDSYDNNLASYLAKSSTIPVYTNKISTAKGKGQFKFRVNRPEWGRYVVQITDPISGHTTGKVFYIDWPYWARTERTNSENATMLAFSTDKETYSAGEKVKLSFPSAEKGKAIVALESGTKVIEKFLIDTEKGETNYEFKTTTEMAPNVYVHVTLLQPHNTTENDMPIRLYGVAPIIVEDPNSHFNPIIKMKDVLRPETTANVTVSEKDGKDMTYTLAIVDDGLLDLTGFKTPRPWDHFYAREALGVKSWDMYDEVMGAFGTEMDKLLAIGGDGSAETKKPTKANRFEPMVRFAGPFHVKAGGQITHKIDVPNYVGSVRVMVVAGQDGKYGNSEKTVPVRSPLMVLGTLPRVLGPTERVFLPVNVFAMEKHVKDVKLSIETNDKVKILGSSTKSISFAKPGDEVVNFEMEVSKSIGIAKVKIIAKSGKETAKHEIELDVRTPNPAVSDIYEGVIDPGESWSPQFAFKGIKGTNSATIEVSSFPPLNLDQRLKYLIRYPHGCIEQTTSSVFPQLALDKVMDLNNDYKIQINQNIKAGIERLKLFQTSEGGFAYWPGQTNDNEWGSNYGGHFILEAEVKGFTLPHNMKKRWVKYQSKMARNYRSSDGVSNFHGAAHYNDLTQAYRLYTLALAKSPEIGAMNRLRESNKLSLTAKWRLAAAYQLIGQTEAAEKLVNNLTSDVPDYKELSYTYGSDLRDEAMILETMILMKSRSKSGALAKKLAEEMNSNQWMSTQTTAYCLLSMSKYLGSSSSDKTMRFTYNVNGGSSISKSTQVAMYKSALKVKGADSGLNIKNTGKGMLYAKLVVEGTPVIGDQSSSSSNLSIKVSYFDMNGRTIDPRRIVQGTDFIAEVKISNPGTRGSLKEMTLNEIFPSGWEIHNTRMDEFTSAVTSSNFDYQDIRDDRVYTYFGLSKGTSKVFKVQLNATYLGKFYLPTIESEAMYDNTVNARTPGFWVEVVKDGGVAMSK